MALREANGYTPFPIPFIYKRWKGQEVAPARCSAALHRLAAYPKIRVSIDIGSSFALAAKLFGGDLELALCSAPELGAELCYEPLFMERFVVLVPEDHPLATRSVIGVEELRLSRLLITAADCPYRRKLELALQESGGPPLDTMEIGSMVALQHYVRGGLGIALVPESALNPAPEGTTVRKFDGRSVDMSNGLLCRAAEYPLRHASAKLYRFLERELRVSAALPVDSTALA